MDYTASALDTKPIVSTCVAPRSDHTTIPVIPFSSDALAAVQPRWGCTGQIFHHVLTLTLPLNLHKLADLV